MTDHEKSMERTQESRAEQLRVLAARQHTRDSFSRAILAHAFRIASKTKPGDDGKITIKGSLTLIPADESWADGGHSHADGSSCWSVSICWVDEERQQSVCEEREMCFHQAIMEE